jgi:hypothetical protein
MSTSRALALALLIVSLPACKGADSEEKAETSAVAPAPAADAQAPEIKPPEAGDAPQIPEPGTETGEEEEEEVAEALPESFEQVGVELCDAYVKDYVACIDTKVPEAEREALRRQVFTNVQAWKQTAAGGSSAQAGLQTGCRIAREQAKRATQSWGCEW